MAFSRLRYLTRMSLTHANLVEYLLNVLRGVLEDLGVDNAGPLGPEVRFADVFDSMAMVEFLGIVSEDCGCQIAAIEEAVDEHFTTVGQLARSMAVADLFPIGRADGSSESEALRETGSVDAPLSSRAAQQLADLEATRVAQVGARSVYLA